MGPARPGDVVIPGLTLIAIGIMLLIVGHGWWRNPSDYLTRALSAGRTVWTYLYAKGPQA